MQIIIVYKCYVMDS